MQDFGEVLVSVQQPAPSISEYESVQAASLILTQVSSVEEVF